jgi:hypothetical protein
MKLFFLICCLPLIATAQVPGRPDDSLRKMTDTVHFPAPFAFTAKGSTGMKEATLFNACYAWLGTVKDSLQGIKIEKDARHKNIATTNVPATADISCTLIITVKGSGYTVLLKDYIYHSINGQQVPVEKAALMKDYKDPVNIERVLILHNYQTIFRALSDFLKQKTA